MRLGREGGLLGRAECSALCLSLTLVAAAAQAEEPRVELGGEVSAGYDTNPAQSRNGPELAFARYAFDVAHHMSLDDSDFAVAVGGWYRDYEADNDSYRLTLRGDWSRMLGDGASLVKVGLEGAAYRDALVPADERNEVALVGRYARILDARATLGVNAEARRLAYRNASLPWAGRPGSGSGNARYGRASTRRNGRATRRDDDLFGLGLDLSYDLTPDLSLVLSATGARCDSPVPLQAYWRRGTGLAVKLAPAADWRLELGLSWSRTRYDRAPRGEVREDDQLGGGLALRRLLGDVELFCKMEWLDSRSTIETRSFRQQVSSCGLAWSY